MNLKDMLDIKIFLVLITVEKKQNLGKRKREKENLENLANINQENIRIL